MTELRLCYGATKALLPADDAPDIDCAWPGNEPRDDDAGEDFLLQTSEDSLCDAICKDGLLLAPQNFPAFACCFSNISQKLGT